MIPIARRYVRLGYNTVVRENLRVMDQSAVILARDHNLPMHVFDFCLPDAMYRLCMGEDLGTLITTAERDELV